MARTSAHCTTGMLNFFILIGQASKPSAFPFVQNVTQLSPLKIGKKVTKEHGQSWPGNAGVIVRSEYNNQTQSLMVR